MKIISASTEILTPDEWFNYALKLIEIAGRTCYKSEEKITSDSAAGFVKGIIYNNHQSVLEHFNVTVRFIVDRGVLAELTRHRLCSYSVESTRFCNYSKDKFKNEITVIKPCFWSEKSALYNAWKFSCEQSEKSYLWMIKYGAKAEEARSILPMSLKTEIVMTANLRNWRHIFELRCSPKSPHPQMREVMVPLLKKFQEKLPIIFNSINHGELT